MNRWTSRSLWCQYLEKCALTGLVWFVCPCFIPVHQQLPQYSRDAFSANDSLHSNSILQNLKMINNV